METGNASPRALVAVAQTSDAALPQSPPVAARSAISRDALVPRTNVIVCLARTSVTVGGVASTQRTSVKVHQGESFHGWRVEPETEKERSLGATGTLEMQASESLQVPNWLEAPRESTLGQKAVD